MYPPLHTQCFSFMNSVPASSQRRKDPETSVGPLGITYNNGSMGTHAFFTIVTLVLFCPRATLPCAVFWDQFQCVDRGAIVFLMVSIKLFSLW